MRFSIEWKVGLGLTIVFLLMDPNNVGWRITLLAVACLLFMDAARNSVWAKGKVDNLSLTAGITSHESPSLLRSALLCCLIICIVVVFGFITWPIRIPKQAAPVQLT